MTAANRTPQEAGATAPQLSHRLMLRLLREYVRPHAGRLIWAAVFMALVAATTGLNAWLLEPAIDKVFVDQVPGMLILVPVVLVVVACLRGGAQFLHQLVRLAQVAQLQQAANKMINKIDHAVSELIIE